MADSLSVAAVAHEADCSLPTLYDPLQHLGGKKINLVYALCIHCQALDAEAVGF